MCSRTRQALYCASMTTAAPRLEERSEDHVVRLSGATWADYQRLLEIRGDRSAPRITYLEGTIEIMSPSRHHESVKSITGCLVEVFCAEHDIEFSTFGSWTIESKQHERGAEPDECYVFGEVAEPERPDLAIEVVLRSGGIDKLEVYRKLGVREVWFWRLGRFQIHVLRGDGYESVAASEVLPGIDLELHASFLQAPTTSQAIREYRKALRRV